MVEVKEICSDQVEQYKAFFQVGLSKDEDNFRISLNDDKITPFPTKDCEDSFTLGAFVEGHQLAGVVSFERDGVQREKLRHNGILFRMYISDGFRNLGIGKKLIEALLDRTKYLTYIEQVNLTVISHNTSAIHLYEKLGFKIFSNESNAIKYKGKYFTELQMVLKLS